VAPGSPVICVNCHLRQLPSCAGQLALWGWRVPFLAAALTAPFALLLRNMIKEPCEFVTSKRQHLLQRIAANAATRVADTFSTQRTISGRLLTKRQIHEKLRNITKVVLSPRASISNADDDDASQHDGSVELDAGSVAMQLPARTPGVSNAGTVCSSRVHERLSEGGSVMRHMSSSCGGSTAATAAAGEAAPAELPTSARPSDAGGTSDLDSEGCSKGNACQPSSHRAPAAAVAAAAAGSLKRCMTADTDRAVAGSELMPGSPFSPFSLHQPMSPQAAAECCALPDQQPELKLWLEEDDTLADIGCELQYVAQLEHAGSKIKRHVPLAVLARQHKQLLWLQFFLESSYAATFYIFTG
jgi:hypothetical protein